MNWEPDLLPRGTGWKSYVQAFFGLLTLTVLFLWANSLDEAAMRARMKLSPPVPVTLRN